MIYIVHRTPRGISREAYPIPGYGYEVRTDLTGLSGKGMKVLQKSQNYWVMVFKSYRNHRTFRVGYVIVQNSQNSAGYVHKKPRLCFVGYGCVL